MKKILLLLVLMASGLGYSQIADINNYKYIVIPEQFEFLKAKNEYNLNALTKMIYEKKGFQVFYPNEELPYEAKMDRCKVLYGDLIMDSSFLTTNLTLVLKDCAGQAVFTSKEGKSKEKEFKKAYYEALREASRSVDVLQYEYTELGTGKTAGTPASVAKKQSNDNLLVAQPTSYGYDLVDKSQKVVLKMYKTSQPDSYSAKMEDVNGVVFKKDDEWFFEFYVDDKPVSQKLNIKF